MEEIRKFKVIFAWDDSNESVVMVKEYLKNNHELILLEKFDNWVEMSKQVAQKVANGDADFGILMCWTGTGTAIAANKVKGIRAATVLDAWTAKGARLWNDANVLAMSLKRLSPDVAVECVEAFLCSSPDVSEADNIKLLKSL